MRTWFVLGLFLIAQLTGCQSASEDSTWRVGSIADCERWQACYSSSYHASFADTDECIDDRLGFLAQNVIECGQTCADAWAAVWTCLLDYECGTTGCDYQFDALYSCDNGQSCLIQTWPLD